MDLEETRADLVDAIAENMAGVAEGMAGEDLGEACELLAQQFQALAICHLLASEDRAAFARNLCLSGFCRRFFLERCAEPNLYSAISRSQSIFDAIAAGADSLASDIARLSPRACESDGEYADDFCYYRLVHALVDSAWALDSSSGAELLGQLERACEPGDVRLRLCAAALARNSADFWSAFAEYLAARQVEARKPLGSDDAWIEPARHIWLEGLAWLRIALELGLPSPQAEYPLCPAQARLTRTDALPEDLFRALAEQADP